MDNIPYTIAGKLLTVCAWHQSGESIYTTYPELRLLDLGLSHGICEACKAKLLEQIQATKNP